MAVISGHSSTVHDTANQNATSHATAQNGDVRCQKLSAHCPAYLTTRLYTATRPRSHFLSGPAPRLCFDSTDPNAIPASAEMVLQYIDGANAAVVEAWAQAAAGRFASAKKIRVACLASTNDGDLLDVEQGNATPGSAPGWVQMRRAAGVDPGVYVNLSNWTAVMEAFQAAAVAQPHYWLAEYDNDPTIPPGADAKQYANEPLTGGNYDISTVSPDWPQGDTMTPEQAQQLADLHFLLCVNQPAGPPTLKDCIEGLWADPNQGQIAVRGALTAIKAELDALGAAVARIEAALKQA